MSATATTGERRVRLETGVEVHLREAGEGEPLLLLHGWPQHGRVWEPVLAALAERHRVLAPDLRGFGRSGMPADEDFRKHALAADAVALLDAEGIERATVIGHDWGGWTAWLLALEHPERVRRLAALDIPPPHRLGGVSARALPKQLLFASYQYVLAAPVLGARLLRSSEAPIRRFLVGGSGRRERWSEEALADYASTLREPARARASSLLYRSFLLREVPRLARNRYTRPLTEVPALTVMGARSPISRLIGVPEPGPGHQVRVLDGVGHYVVDEAPEELLGLLDAFLDRD